MSYDSSASLIEHDGRRCIKYKNSSTAQKDLTACCPKFKEKTRYIFSLEARPYEIMSESNQYNGELYVNFKPKDTYVATPSGLNAKRTRDFTRIYAVVKPDSTITDINLSWGSAYYWLIDLDSVYLYEYEGDDSPSYDPPLVSEVIIPAKITQDDGTELVLSLGENEELVYERERLTCKKGQDVYDFSGTELHEALKSLNTVYDTDFTLEIKGEGTPLSITASYYSTQNQDERALTVSYLCSGKEILDTRTYAVRKDSIYKIIPPYIKGYKPQCKEQHGIITEDTNIILSYSKE